VEILAPWFEADGPGGALATWRDGEPARFVCRGLADLDSGAPITPETRFDLASASKPFTAVVILRLAARGLLGLDTPLHELIPECPPPAAGRAVIVADLLRHTSGLADYLAEGGATPDEETTAASVAARLPGWAQAARPGVAFEYSNTNYVALARIAERLTGRPFPEVVAAEVLAPCGLARTHVQPIPPPGAARGYGDDGYGLPAWRPGPDSSIATLGDGGVWSCLTDLVTFLSRLWSGDLVPAPWLQPMRQAGQTDDGTALPYGLGLQMETTPGGERWVGHGGSWLHSTTLIGRYEPAGFNVVVLSNLVGAPVTHVSRHARTALGGR
jgi:CubicO group peptidase (beta-lactamase class C family)